MKRTVLIVAVAALCVAGSAVAQDRSGQWMGNGGRAEDGGQIMGSGTRSEDGTPIFGSGGYLGSGNRTADASGGLIGSGTRSEDSGQVIGSGLSVLQFRLPDGSSLLVMSSDERMFFILIEE